MRMFICLVMLSLATVLLCFPVSAAEPSNILNMSEGTTVLSYSGEYDAGKWSALHLFDGDPKTSWCSPANALTGQTFTVELPQRYKLQKIAVDTRQVQEQGYPGCSLKTLEVWGSTESAKAEFTKLATIAATKQARTVSILKATPEVQWLKFVVVDDWGNKQFVELSEIEAYGIPLGKVTQPSFTGVFSSNFGPIKLKQDGGLVSGCYPFETGSVHGAVDGRVLRFDWKQKGNGHTGTALMVLDSSGKILNGAWYSNGTMQGEWLGKKDDSLPCNCEIAGRGGIAERLKDANCAILYGIYFDLDSAVIKPESQATLTELLDTLQDQANLKVKIEGHTDSTNTDQYNQALSLKRAQAIVSWLQSKGIPLTRMIATGFGESKPVADNATPQGRALNRRVEVRPMM